MALSLVAATPALNNFFSVRAAATRESHSALSRPCQSAHATGSHRRELPDSWLTAVRDAQVRRPQEPGGG